MKRITRNIEFLRALRKGNNKVRRALIKKASNAQLISVCELNKNILAGTLPVSKKVKSKLCKYKRIIRKLVSRRVPIREKRQLLQKGGLPILPLVLGVLGPLIGKAVSKLIPGN